MPYTIYDHVDEHGRNTIKEWTSELQAPDRAKVDQKIDMLITSGSDLPPKLLSDSRSPHIKKLRLIGLGKVQLRPMFCKGPINNYIEFTLLMGAIEKGSKLDPPDADYKAENLRQEVIANPSLRRCPHE